VNKLRELAERWKGDGCRNGSSHECADELLQILDAEGDGVAVACGYLITWRDPTYRGKQTLSFDRCREDDGTFVPVYTHHQPARSDVVSDEQVDSACSAYIAADRFLLDGAVDSMREAMRAALEHFAKSQGESNV
jgi:hypothetical protein